jgi:hypothetical protein
MIMKTWPIIDAQGKVAAFEVSVIRIGLREIAKVLESLPGVLQLQKGSSFGGEEVRIKFTYHGINCVVWEPFGDNSRYWIGPANEAGEQAHDLVEIEKAFRSYQPSVLKRLFGRLKSV